MTTDGRGAPPRLPPNDEELASMAEMMLSDVNEFAFDSDYLRFLKEHDRPGRVGKTVVGSDGDEYPVDVFLHYADPTLLDDRLLSFLNANVAWSAIEDRLGPGLLPFAMNPGGDYYCFDYRAGASPTVVLWKHEYSADEGGGGTPPVAANFSDFIAGMS